MEHLLQAGVDAHWESSCVRNIHLVL